MPILSSGSNVTLAVAAGQILTVECNASAEYIFENPVGTRVGDYACRNVFGPFTVAASVKLTSSTGSLFYELATAESFNSGFTQCLWANRPASASLYDRILVTDYGVPGLRMVWDGTRWALDGVQVLARSSAGIVCPADTTEDTLVSVTVPAGLLGVNGSIRCRGAMWSCTNNANAKTIRARWTAANIVMQASIANSGFTPTDFVISNRGATASQEVYGLANGGVVTAGVTGVDTTVAQTLTLTAQKATAGDTVSLDHYVIEVAP